MSLEFLQALYDGRFKEAESFEHVRLHNDAAQGIRSGSIEWRLTAVKAAPELAPWVGRWMVRRADEQVVGDAGFKSAPGQHPRNSEISNLVEMGYFVSSEFRNQGYATEACSALVGWANGEHDVNDFQLQIAPSNAASIRVAEKLEFSHESNFLDDQSGTSLGVYRLSLGADI